MPPPRPHAPKLERLEPRDQPSASALGNLVTTPVSPFDLLSAPGSAAVGGSVYFAANDGAHAAAVWKSDGTAAGTKLVAALPARTDGGLVGRPANFVALNGKVYFTYDDGTHGAELWVTDGTAGGTKMVSDLDPGPDGSDPGGLTPVGGVLVFLAHPVGYAASAGTLFATDGTAAGTVPLMDLSDYSVGFVAAGSKLYFTQTTVDPVTFATTTQIWATDGTKAGTKTFAMLPDGVSIPGAAYMAGGWGQAVGSKFYFAGYSADAGTELWVTDGTAAGTKMVKDINPGGAVTPAPGYPGSSDPAGFAVVGNTLYFSADDGIHGTELWKSDGTAAGTKMVVDLSPDVGSFYPTNPYSSGPVQNGSAVGPLTAADGKLYFSADDGTHGPQLYVSDGTAAGTTALTAVDHGSDFTPTSPYGPGTDAPAVAAATPGRVWFTMADEADGRQLWATDGTPAGTAMVRAIDGPANTLSGQTGPVPLGTVGGKLLFHDDDGVNGRQLWASDGTAAGTAIVTRINPDDQGSAPGGFVVANGKAYFTANNGVYVTDGKSAPQLLKAFDAVVDPVYPAPETPSQLTASGGAVYFITRDSQGVTTKLWKTDGTPAGTVVLKEYTPGAEPSPFVTPGGIDNLTDVNGTLFFTVDLPGVGQQLWKTNGTAAGTTLVRQMNDQSSAVVAWDPPTAADPFFVPRPIRQLTAVGNKVYFSASSETAGTELWVSDGTEAGTKMVKDIDPGTGDGAPIDMTPLNGKVYFTAFDGTNGRQLWVTDGTAAGTKLAATIGPVTATDWGPGMFFWNSAPRTMTAAGGKLFFLGQDPGAQLWVSDGTTAGTKAVSSLPGVVWSVGTPGSTAIGDLTAAGGLVYFTANDPTFGRQLYVSDGTSAGTHMVGPVGDGSQVPATWPGAPKPGANPSILAVAGTTIYFAADDGVHGRELWQSDGTAAGTKLLYEFIPGPVGGLTAAGSYFGGTPGSAAVVNGRLVLAADDGSHGAEPWAVTLAPTVPPVTGDVTGPRVLDAAFTGAKAGSFDRVTVHFSEAVNPATLGNATVKVTTPGGPVGVSAVLAVAGDPTRFTLMLAKAQTAGGSYTVVIGPAVTDAAGNPMDQNGNGTNGEAADAFTATAALGSSTVPPVVPPTIPPTVPPTVSATVVRTFAPAPAEGATWSGNLASVTLPAGPAYTVTILWGDGRSSVGTLTRNTPTGATYTISGSHLYADPGAKTIQVRVNGAGGKMVLAFDVAATVADARFYVGRVAQRLPAAAPFTGPVATISDTNPGGKATDYAATIAWGDGATSAGRVVKTADGKFEVDGDHTFLAAGQAKVTVTVRSLASGTTASVDSVFVVDPARP